MNTSQSELPRPKLLHRLLGQVKERLACELAQPADDAPRWSDREWRLARAVAAIHGVSALMASRTRWQGPPGWRTFVEEQRDHVAARHARIELLLEHLDQRFRAVGVAAMALKGAALHSSGLYRAGERPMADVDLLVR
jgi:hypothetical protein